MGSTSSSCSPDGEAESDLPAARCRDRVDGPRDREEDDDTDSRYGGCGFIGSNSSEWCSPSVRTGRSPTSTSSPTRDVWRISPTSRATRDTVRERRHLRPGEVRDAMAGCTVCANFAAETHIDGSLLGAGHSIDTDMKDVLRAPGRGAPRRSQTVHPDLDRRGLRVDRPGLLRRRKRPQPRNPYSASKAGGDRLAFAYWATYGVPVSITRASNNYGPFQYPEKLVPLFVTNALRDEALPLYGDGRNVRDWLHVEDHCRAVLFVLDHGADGEVYNIAEGNSGRTSRSPARLLRLLGKPASLIRPVEDRVGHDRRYSLDAGKLRRSGGRRGCRSGAASRRLSAGTSSTKRGGARSRTTTGSSGATTRSSTGNG